MQRKNRNEKKKMEKITEKKETLEYIERMKEWKNIEQNSER